LARDDSADIQETIATVQKELDQTLPADDRNKTSAIFPDVIETAERILSIPAGGERNYIATGYHDLDSRGKPVEWNPDGHPEQAPGRARRA